MALRLWLALILLALTAGTTAAREPVFELERNATLETVSIMFLITPSIRTPDIGMRPEAEAVRRRFRANADHPSIRLLDAMVREKPDRSWISWLQILTSIGVASETPPPHAAFNPARIGVDGVHRPGEEAQWTAFMEAVNLGPRIVTEAGDEALMIIGPMKVTRDAEAYGCGFDDADTMEWLTIHEIGHSFVNPVLATPASMQVMMAHTDLYAPIREEMTEQGMPDWEGAAVEHVVRLGEIRVLESLGLTSAAESRRLQNVFERKFIYLPLLEARIAEYERDRQNYPTFETFLPRLYAAFGDPTAR